MNRLFPARGLLVLAAAAALALVLPACDEGPCGQSPNTLEGSIGELYDIDTDHVVARKLPDEATVVIEYYHGEDIVSKVVADVRDFKKGASIPLVDGTVYRVTSPPTDFPEDVDAGVITFETDLTVGENVVGCWNVKFNMDDGGQRTLNGTFEAKLEGA